MRRVFFLQDFLFSNVITGFINLFHFGCCSFSSGQIISNFPSMSNSLINLSCKCIGTLLASCFLNSASAFSG